MQRIVQADWEARAAGSCAQAVDRPGPGCWDAPAPKAGVPHCQQAASSFARQAPSAGSPSSEASSGCAMGCGCSTPPAGQRGLAGTDSDSAAAGGGSEGWFSKCRGCGCMTAHEQVILGADVPFCRRCQATLDGACPGMKSKMVDALLYVHKAWSSAGL